jgi:hypothetical protein
MMKALESPQVTSSADGVTSWQKFNNSTNTYQLASGGLSFCCWMKMMKPAFVTCHNVVKKFYFEISSFLLQSNSAHILVSAVSAFKEILT